MSTADAARRDLRRMLPEFTAVIEEYREAWVRPGRNYPDHPTYGEQILTLVSPLLVSYAEAVRRPEYIDTLPDEEVLSLHAVISPTIELRRSRREAWEQQLKRGRK